MRKSTKVRVNKSTRCQTVFPPAACFFSEGLEKADKENITGMKLLSFPSTQDVCFIDSTFSFLQLLRCCTSVQSYGGLE